MFGDIQGGLRELLLLFHETGFPSDCGGDVQVCAYVFNGNFVDVGLHQVEVLCLLFALKVLYPSRIWLIRGNHEFREQNAGASGFRLCCLRLFLDGDDGAQVFEAAHAVFDWLPVAAVVAGAIFVCHGGVSHERGEWFVEDLLLLDKYRPIQSWAHKAFPDILLQLLWSSPDDAHADWNRSVCNHVWQRERKVGEKRPVTFAQRDAEAFMDRNSIQLIIRSHQVPARGAAFHHNGKTLTVFSSKNYNGQGGNAGAMALICLNEEGEVSCRIKTTS